MHRTDMLKVGGALSGVALSTSLVYWLMQRNLKKNRNAYSGRNTFHLVAYSLVAALPAAYIGYATGDAIGDYIYARKMRQLYNI